MTICCHHFKHFTKSHNPNLSPTPCSSGYWELSSLHIMLMSHANHTRCALLRVCALQFQSGMTRNLWAPVQIYGITGTDKGVEKVFQLLSFSRQYSCITRCRSVWEWMRMGVVVSAKIDRRMTKTSIPSHSVVWGPHPRTHRNYGLGNKSHVSSLICSFTRSVILVTIMGWDEWNMQNLAPLSCHLWSGWYSQNA